MSVFLPTDICVQHNISVHICIHIYIWGRGRSQISSDPVSRSLEWVAIGPSRFRKGTVNI